MIHPGIAYALVSALLFGASTPFAKLFLGPVSPAMAAGLLYLGAGTGLAVIQATRAMRGRPAAEAPLRRADLPWLALVIIAGGLFGPLLLMLGLARTGASTASLLLNLEGLATMVIAWLWFRENVDRRLLVGAFAILLGAVILSWQGHAAVDWGGVPIVGACLCWGLDNNLTRKLSAADPVQLTMIKGLAAGTVNVAGALATGASLPAFPTLGAIAAIGFLGYGISLMLFMLALRHLGAARTGAYFSLAPFVGAVIAIPLLAEPLSLQLALAAMLMGVGLWLHLAERHEHDHVHEALEHEHSHVHDAHHQHDHEPGMPSGEPHSHQHLHVPRAPPSALPRSPPPPWPRALNSGALAVRSPRRR